MYNHNYNKILKSDWLSTILILLEWDSRSHTKVKGSFSNDDDNGNEKVKNALALISKTTISRMQYFFSVHYLAVPGNQDVKFHCAVFSWKKVQTHANRNGFSFSKLGCGPKNSTPGKFTNT